MQQAATALAAEMPLFGPSSEHALLRTAPPPAVRPAACAIFTVVMRRCAELDEDAADRGVRLLAQTLLVPGADARSLQAVIEEVLEGVGRVAAAKEVEAILTQRCSLTRLLERAVALGGSLRPIVVSAVLAHGARAGSSFETICPAVLCNGSPSLLELVEISERLLKTLARMLASCHDQKVRLRAVACADGVWERAASRWPEEMDECAQPTNGAMDLAANVINATVATVLYDPVAKLRLSAIRGLPKLAVALKSAQVLKLAILKARDRDKDVRKVGLEVMATLSDGGAQGLSGLSASQVQQVLVHGIGGASANEQTRALARKTFWEFMFAKHDVGPAGALAELQAMSQLPLIEPLLREGHCVETFAAAFPEANERGEAGGDEMQE